MLILARERAQRCAILQVVTSCALPSSSAPLCNTSQHRPIQPHQYSLGCMSSLTSTVPKSHRSYHHHPNSPPTSAYWSPAHQLPPPLSTHLRGSPRTRRPLLIAPPVSVVGAAARCPCCRRRWRGVCWCPSWIPQSRT
ncbi:hypothetical protein BAUCODRAFT_190482 [Baudoinia panamericana UAMH 10762]|uniref:Uncharacterized protein n=1 Tax=Baudoinia panamericana (strain UAMH 10762) TaxID=717646 RepID=M2M1P3_BAUPA|nr:uncharacterized protein BAUCODRAFT_190482 [Baudoinia panamericana UAMH 10762]EMD00973.1 hypothetical protein BAUCODRAFT_190482 [Baudoinia panamericana UAMH 10762]